MSTIYTKTGDGGETALFGGKRVKKSCLEIDVIGDVDETNALIGVLASELNKAATFRKALQRIRTIQHRLFVVGSNIAAVQMSAQGGPALGWDKKLPKLLEADVQALEQWIDEMQEDLEPLTQFILPGGAEAAAHAFMARAICRRAERRYVDLVDQYPALNPLIGQYLNRLSDVLFVLARWINMKKSIDDVVWEK